jgi:predicted enzyme related to lactoylglutathione lyase
MPIAQPITMMPWGERSLHCLDPDGNIVELFEKRS